MATTQSNAGSRILLAVVGCAVAGVAGYYALQLARIDAKWGEPKGPDRTMELIDEGTVSGDAAVEVAKQNLALRPLDGRAYRVLAMDALARGDTDAFEKLIAIAVKRAPRDRITRAAMLDKTFQAGDYATAFENMDALFRDAPDFVDPIAQRLAPALADETVRNAMDEKLKSNPPWKDAFIRTISKDPSATQIAREMWSSGQDIRPTEDHMYDPGFEREIGTSPFEWQMPNIPGIEFRTEAHRALDGKKSLRLNFQGRAVKLYGPSQSLTLEPGTYSMTVLSRDETTATRPFAWVLRCDEPNNNAEITRVEFGQASSSSSRNAINHTFELRSVCKKQRFALVLLSRNIAEAQLQGSLWTEIKNFSQSSN